MSEGDNSEGVRPDFAAFACLTQAPRKLAGTEKYASPTDY